ncbi:hemolysin III family protein [Frateuria edaphi]|uniref:PAQR family membrane homeostasis protein TrhA n=1 Tax=Frateuria edaphi TaxID=2898793 RepID=UPI001E3579D5|nr:hemolysin III family protein [Frateuria edaphi]UGB47264.1 hemolysin III family protein [Frateuria edaphi]
MNLPRRIRKLARASTTGEEIANSISHGLGLLLAIAGLPLLILDALRRGGALPVLGAAVFGGSAIVLYLASTLYHAIPHARAKSMLRRFDHAAIYLLIAGTYTPIALGVLRGGVGWALLAVIWTLAVAGVIFKLLVGARFHRLSTGLYVAMGWLALAAIRPLWQHMAPGGLAWLLAGGLAYTVGVVFYLLHEKLRYSHFAWHLFVLAGTGCHYFAVWRYAH